MAQPNKALLALFFGARGSGKTYRARKFVEAQRPNRLIVWDFKGDPGLDGIGKAYNSLPDMMRAMNAPSFKLRYIVDHEKDVQEQFKWFCLAAWEAGSLFMMVCELPEVTKANGGPPIWRRCVNVGRDYVHKGIRKWLSIVADGQRPAEVDKSIIANADVTNTGRLAYIDDAQQMAKFMNCDQRELVALPNWHSLERREGQIEPIRSGPAAKKPRSRKPA